eukprot:g3090.t1
MGFEIVFCCAFVRRRNRKRNGLHSLNDQPALQVEQKTAVLVSETNEQTHNPVSLQSHPGSPTSSEGEFYDCHSELSNNLASNSSQNLDIVLESTPEIPPTVSHFSLWNWLTGWGGQSRGQVPAGKLVYEVSPESRTLEDPSVASCSTVDIDNRSRMFSAYMNLMSHNRHTSSTSKDTKLIAGATFAHRKTNLSLSEANECWESGDATKYKVRSKNYLRSRIKEPCIGSFYEVIASDLLSFDKKQSHVAQFIKLPGDPYKRSIEEMEAIQEYGLPTLLVVNMQLPAYQPSFLGSDGRGHSFIFYCVLHERFNPRTHSNQYSLKLFSRFVANPENQGQYRIKLIPKFLNIEEWAEKGPLTQTEHRLVKIYNEKPILTRQHNRFFRGDNYFEIDVDVHQWIYIAKKAFWSLLLRMHQVVTEVALLIQGNRPEDLPEQIVASARVYRVDLARFRYIGDFKQQIIDSNSTQKCQNGKERVIQD